ncbi:MAG: oligosaccharide flippase family protein, partial [Candidatus Peribacteraceae bacterium]|nr:oligosaccharide flippase family protein [Candidatus Peribacteraceae bacterium]
MSTKQIASSTLWQLASQLAMAAISVVTVKLVATGLSQNLAGFYNSAYGYLQIFGIIADFGLYAVAVREVSRSEDKRGVVGAVIVLRCVITAVSFALAVAVAWVIPAWHGTPLPLAVTLCAFVPVFTLLAGTLRVIFQVHYRLQWVFVAEVTQRIVAVA